jgi:DNA-binding transcriptional ArsR family regulator
MGLPHPLPDPLIEAIASRFRAIGDPMRIRLLDRLRTGEATVQELADAAGTSQQNVSKHLRVLRQGAIVDRRKAGSFVYYRITDPAVLDLCEVVCAMVGRQVAELGQALAAGGRR